MARQDLLALTFDDLATLTNRGIAKRAQQEVETMAGETAEDEAGNVTVQWPDEEVTCVIPAAGGFNASTCTCPATTLCRHIVRSVLAYQRANLTGEPRSFTSSDVSNTSAEAPSPANAQPWDPGTIRDEQLAQHISAAALTKARRLFDAGQVIELVRSAKPTARLHSLSSNVRFLVPGDVRYTYCDCAETQPCTHVSMAVWAFRLLDADRHSGIVSTEAEAHAAPTDVLDDAEGAMRQLIVNGFSNLSASELTIWRRIEAKLRSAGLIWPAEIVAELVTLHDAYSTGDSQFVSARVPELLGELLARSDAIRSNTGAVPQFFIRGSASDRTTDIGSARLIGLGCGVRVRRRGVQLAAYLQDMDSGMTVAITRLRSDPSATPPSGGGAGGGALPEPPRPFADLAASPVVKGVNLRNIGFGQLLIKGGKRTASCEFLPGRAPVTFSPQSYRWESLRPPLYAEDFDELRGRIEAQPGASLMPRRVAGSLSVCAVELVAAVRFDSALQVLEAIIADRGGKVARLTFPYYVRNAPGFDRLFAALSDPDRSLKFISGEFRLGAGALEVSPVALVFERSGVREMVQPWVDPATESTSQPIESQSTATVAAETPIDAIVDDLLEALTDVYQLGANRIDPDAARTWRDIAARGSACGLTRLPAAVGKVANMLSEKSSTLHWQPEPIAAAVADLTAATRLALDLRQG